MSLSFTVVTTAADRVAAELLAVPVAKGAVFGPGAETVDTALDGGLATFIAEAGFEGKLGETLAVPTAGRLRAKAAVLVGIGDPAELTVDGVRRAAAAVARRASKAASVATTLATAGSELAVAEAAQAVAEGFVLGAYQYLEYKGNATPSKLKKVTVIAGGGAPVRNAVERGATVGDAVTWARDLVNTPAIDKTPSDMAAAARKLLRGTGVTVQVLDVKQLQAQRMGGVLGVAQGSVQAPRFLKMTYAPSGARGKPLALVGKGVVFDSGGLSLKTSSGMETMKTDMSGGAAVIAAMSTLGALGVKTRVTGYVPLVENMPSGNAIRPGDVLKIRNGKTVEVLNTDAEGRLILADALSLASDEKPGAVIDLATLTGACMVALGDKIAGLMGNDDDWSDQVRAAADRAGEPVWPLPLPPEYRKQLESEVADLKNIGGSYGGALTAGLFLQEFVVDAPWVHLDIAGPARANADDGYLAKGGTGFGVRTLVELARAYEAPAALIRRLALVVVTASLAAATFVPGTAAAHPEGRDERRVATVRKTVTVHIRDNTFSPANLDVEDGTTVRWINDGRNDHNVTPSDGKYFGSKNLKPGRAYVHTFSDPGSYAYYCTLHGTPTSGQHATLGVGDASAATPVEIVGSSDAAAPSFTASGRTIRVPADAKTIQAGVDRARKGDLVLVSPGVYKEQVTVSTEGIVLRGVDRNRTILDGEFERQNGVFVVEADGVAVENLTARNFTENGFLWNGVLGYRGSYLTAYRNGDYGVYAYNSQYGQFDHSYASGSPDSGFYIGQCNPCHAVITDVVSEYNLLGYSGSNSSGDLFLVNSDWSHNRTGIVPNSFGAEELSPQGQATIAGNVVSDNGDARATRGNEAAYDPAYGVGVLLAGGQEDVVTKNRIVDNAKVGVALAPSIGLEDVPHQPKGNRVTDNVVERSGMVDLGVVLSDAADENCFSGNTFSTSAPANIEQVMPCDATGTGDFATGAVDIQQFLDPTGNAKGVGYKESPIPKRQRNMPRATSAKARPAGAPAPVDLAAIEVPAGT